LTRYFAKYSGSGGDGRGISQSIRGAVVMDDLICMHYVVDQLDEWLENATTITSKVSDIEYVRASDIEKFKREMIYNLGVNQRIQHHG
jgi:hypothetical protein